jgi:polyhydroxyalkanoate synthase
MRARSLTTAPAGMIDRIRHDVDRTVSLTRNAMKHLSGYGRPAVGLTPKDVVWSRGKVELWRYRSDRRRISPPLLIVHSLVTRNYVFDLRPGNSFVEHMLARGFDVFLVEWGRADELDAHNDLSHYCDDLLPDIVRATTRAADASAVTLFGYCLGGLLSLLYAAGHPHDPVSALAVMATPIDFTALGPVATMLERGRVDPRTVLDNAGNVPVDVIRHLFRVLQPGLDINGYANLVQHLGNDQFVTAHKALMRWANDHVAFPGAVFVELAELAREQRLRHGRIPVSGREVDLRDITAPFLAVVADHDRLVPPPATGGLCSLVGSADRQELHLPTGHIGLILGSGAQRKNIPAMADWLERHRQPRQIGARKGQ